MTKSKKNLFLVVLMAVLSLSMAVFAGGITTVKANTSTDIVAGTNFKVGGVQVRTAEDGVTGLGFVTEIDKELVGALGEGNFETGTIIMPAYYLDKGVELTLESVESFGLTSKCVIPNQGFNNRKAVEEEKTSNFYTFRGSLVEINPDNYTLDFASVGYITYNGETVYSAPTGEHLVANVDEVATAYAKTEYFAEDIEAEAPYVAQINAYTEAWDLKENEDGTVTLFDPENDWRRLTYANSRYNYDRVVSASSLGFAGKEYTGSAVELRGLTIADISLDILGSKHYEKLINSGEYDYISMYVAVKHNSPLPIPRTGLTWVTDNAHGLFGGISSTNVSKNYRSLSLTDDGAYERWTKITVPTSAIKEHPMFTEDSTKMNLLMPTASGVTWATEGEETDSIQNYYLYIGKIIAENEEHNEYLLDPDGSLGYVNASSTATYNGNPVKATAEELQRVTEGVDYNGGALKVVTKGNTLKTWLYYNEDLEQGLLGRGYKYVSLHLAFLCSATNCRIWFNGADTLTGNLIRESILVDGDSPETTARYFPINTWVNLVVPIEWLFDREFDDANKGQMTFTRCSNGSNWGGGLEFLFGEIKLLKDAPIVDGTPVEQGSITGSTRFYNPIPTDAIEQEFSFDDMNVWNKSVKASAVDSSDAMYSESVGSAEKVAVTANISLSHVKSAANTAYSNVKNLTKWYNPPYYSDYKYLVTYVAISGDDNTVALSYGAGMFYTANGKKAVVFGGEDGLKYNTWYKVVIPFATYQANSVDSSWGEYLLSSGTSSSNAFAGSIYFGDFELVTEAPADYNGSWITEMVSAN